MNLDYLPADLRNRANRRADDLFVAQMQQIARGTDRLLATLLFIEWMLCVVTAAASGTASISAALAVIGSGLSVAVCALLVLARPARGVTRQVIGAVQMVVAGLLCALIEPRCDSQAYVFGSLALLSLYRDWRVLVWASLVAAVYLGIYGPPLPAVAAGAWDAGLARAVERGVWMLLADVVLIYSCRQDARQRRILAERQASLEMTNELVAAKVAEQTASLRHSVAQLTEHEALLYHSQSKLRSVFDSPMLGIAFWDLDGSVREANAALLEMGGYTAEELHAGQISWTELTPEDQLPRMRQTLAEIEARGVCVPYEREFLRKDGSRLSVLMSAAKLRGGETYGVACLLDITQRKRAEEALGRTQDQLRHIQKIEGIGRLAGGIAHDFNNILTVVSGFAEFIVEDPQATADVRDRGQEILSAVHRGSALTGQLLAFSRKQVQAPTRLDLNTVVTETSALLHRLIGKHVELILELQPEAWIHADRSQVEQVIMNLAVNARDALADGGQIRIATSPARLEAGHPDLADHMQPGPYVLLTVSDTGCGMSDEVRKHVFEPFFTTKPAGKGTGMGLAIVYGIVTQTGGSIDVESTPNQGTVLRIYLPQQAQPGQHVPGPSPGTGGPAAARPGSQPAPRGSAAGTGVLLSGSVEIPPVSSPVC